jgi:cytoplasmic iron level regulating protein YaaA (DUF328/UPF0246 family)
MIILIHSSKAMRSAPASKKLRPPQLLSKAQELAAYLKTLTATQLARSMSLSAPLAKKTQVLIADWNVAPKTQTLAIDSFIGDIYSGMQAPSFSTAERTYADKTLYILSGLYGILRPMDGIHPYRLEMGYRLPDKKFANLYKYWGDSIAACLPANGQIVNLAADEYSKTITPYVDEAGIVAPRFLTISPKTGEPAFVVVHAKIARGAFARWLIVNRIDDVSDLKKFDDIGYRYVKKLSQPAAPVFMCKEFGGTGLSIRMQDG